jgi:predicted membrane channel-forming protein YqfA (hemolysin III family)
MEVLAALLLFCLPCSSFALAKRPSVTSNAAVMNLFVVDPMVVMLCGVRFDAPIFFASERSRRCHDIFNKHDSSRDWIFLAICAMPFCFLTTATPTNNVTRSTSTAY